MEQHKKELGTKKDLVSYRLQAAKADLKSARILLAAEEYKGANNRAYYAIFHAINAIHALSGKAYKSTVWRSSKLLNEICDYYTRPFISTNPGKKPLTIFSLPFSYI